MKFVYVFTGDNQLYSGVTAISALFLRYLHPDAEIILLTDRHSENILANRQEMNVFSSIISFDTPYTNPHYASRYIRCNMRKKLKGDFLYLDSDTLPKKNLFGVAKAKGDIAAVLNHNTGNFDPTVEPEGGALEEFGWTLISGRYLNAGVQFWRDTEAAAEVSSQWFSNWLMFSEKKTHHDQIAFNAAMCATENFSLLEAEYNLQIKSCSSTFLTESARLWHYYMSDNNIPVLIREYIEILNKEKTLPGDFINSETARDTPVCAPLGVPDKLVNRILYEDTSTMPLRELKLTDLALILPAEKIAIFGTGLSGTMTHDYLSEYKNNEELVFIDDSRVEPFRGLRVVSTDIFIGAMQSEYSLIVCGKHQRLNERLTAELSIPLLRLDYIE